jgi:hypothetical protein
MQLTLPLDGLAVPPPRPWERLAPEEKAEAVAMLARLMANVVRPQEEEEQPDERNSA